VGRTGAFIALDCLLEQADAEGVVDVVACTNQMRKDRVNMIQTVVSIYTRTHLSAVCTHLYSGHLPAVCTHLYSGHLPAVCTHLYSGHLPAVCTHLYSGHLYSGHLYIYNMIQTVVSIYTHVHTCLRACCLYKIRYERLF